MATIKDVLALPDKCPISELQGKIAKVYERKEVNGKSKQAFLLTDAGGNKIIVSAWGHGPLDQYENQEVYLKAGPKGGFSVNIFNGKTGLNMSASTVLTLVAGGQVPTPQPAAQNAPDAKESQVNGPFKKSIHPATVGMCINQACANLTEQGFELDPKKVYVIASKLVKVALYMEAGNLAGDPAPEKAQAPEQAPAVTQAPVTTDTKDVEEDDIPF